MTVVKFMALDADLNLTRPKTPVQVSSGDPLVDGGNLVALNSSTGKIDPSLIPGGIGSGSGSGGSFTYNFLTPQSTLNIVHDLGKYPSVTIVDTSGNEIEAAYTYVDSNTIIIYFSSDTTGYVYLN